MSAIAMPWAARALLLTGLCLMLAACASAPVPPSAPAPAIPMLPAAPFPGLLRPLSSVPDSFMQSTRGYYNDAIQASTLLGDSRGASPGIINGFVRLAGQQENFAFQNFYHSRLNSGTSAGQLSLEFDWEGGAPPESGGLYVGITDISRQRWVWAGPILSPADIVDFSPADPRGDDSVGLSDFCIVNYSDTAVQIRFMNYTLRGAGETPNDDSVYFIQRDEQQLLHIMKMPLLGAGSESVYKAPAGAELRSLYLLGSGPQQRLAFNQRSSGGKWQILSCSLDGSDVQSEHEAAGKDCIAGEQLPGSNLECYARISDAEVELVVHDHSEGSESSFATSKSDILDLLGLRWLAGGPGKTSQLLAILSPGDGTAADLQRLNLNSNFEPKVGHARMLPQNFAGSSGSFSCFRYVCAAEQIHRAQIHSWQATEGELPGLFFYVEGNIFAVRHRPVISRPGRALRWPSVSPDTRWIAYVDCAPGADSGELRILPLVSRNPEDSLLLAADVLDTPLLIDPTPKLEEQ